MASTNRDAALTGDWRQQHSVNLAHDAAGTAFGRTEGIGCAHAEFITFDITEGIGCVPMQKLLLLAELKALGMCPCRMYYFWHNGRHWVCAHTEGECQRAGQSFGRP